MQIDPDALKLANDSGFPLQIAIERTVNETSSIHGWKVRYVEHAWVNPSDQQSGFIDLVLENQHGNAFLVVECKRLRQTTWLFMHSTGEVMPRLHAKTWASNYASGKMANFGWSDIAILPASPEALFCAVRGQNTNDKSTLLERVGGELISSTEAFAREQRDFRPDNYQTLRLYFNVIVTTAELKVAKFDPAGISLTDGTIADAEFESVPFVRLRKQLSMQPIPLSPIDYSNRRDISYDKQNTVFVVRADSLTSFLEAFEMTNESLRQFHQM